MERSAHGVQLSRSAHAHFSSLLNFESLKNPENRKKISIYIKSTDFSFFPFWESSGLEMAGWLAGLGAGQAGWAGRQAGWSWPVPRPASQPAISSPELFPKKEKKGGEGEKKKKQLILRKL